MKKRNNFTLVEMLTVVAIIGILAGLVIPTVIIAKNRGQVTQAKTDISSIMTALKQVKTDYGRILLSKGEINTDDIKASVASDIATIKDTAFDGFIAELSAPKNSGLTQTASSRINKRKKVYLDPKNGFDPTKKYNEQKESLYRDPWGSPYIVYVKMKNTSELAIPGTTKTIPSDVAIYSWGPNGTDDGGCNVELDTCISSGNHKNHDDIASWNL